MGSFLDWLTVVKPVETRDASASKNKTLQRAFGIMAATIKDTDELK